MTSLEDRIREHYIREDHPSVFELLDVVNEQREDIEQFKIHCSQVTALGQKTFTENARLRAALADAIDRVGNSRKGSCGSIDNIYVCQIGVEEVGRWRKALEKP